MPSFMKCLILGVTLVAVFAVQYSDARPTEDITPSEDNSGTAVMEDLEGLLGEYEDQESRARRSVDGWNEFAPAHPFDGLMDADEAVNALFRERRGTMVQAPMESDVDSTSDSNDGEGKGKRKGKGKKRGKGKGKGRKQDGSTTQDEETNN